MQKRLLIGSLLVAVWCLNGPLALGETARTPVYGSRTAKCQADCRPGTWDKAGVGMHGHYRSYGAADPKLVSPEGRKSYAECVRICLAPLPSSYFQRGIIESGASWFGSTKKDCLTCHARGETKGRWPGAIMRTDALRREQGL